LEVAEDLLQKVKEEKSASAKRLFYHTLGKVYIDGFNERTKARAAFRMA